MTERSKPPFAPITSAVSFDPTRSSRAREQAEKQEISHRELQRVQQAAIRECGTPAGGPSASRWSPTGEFTASLAPRLHAQFANVRMMPAKLTVRFHSADGDRCTARPTMQVTAAGAAA